MGKAEEGQGRTAKEKESGRSKPKKWAPKSRLGCKTCKIRKVKCDLAQPSCLKCTSTGRACDGYSHDPYALKTDHQVAVHHSSFGWSSSSSPRQSGPGPGPGPGHHDPGPLMILPATGPAQTAALRFFERVSVAHLSEYRPGSSGGPWRRSLMFFCQTEPAVRHAALALALLHRRSLDDGRPSTSAPRRRSPAASGSGSGSGPGASDSDSDSDPLLHYNRAIHHLLHRGGSTGSTGDGTGSARTTAVTLLVCYLFTCLEHLAGNDVQAMTHLRGGVALARNAGLERSSSSSNSSSSSENGEDHDEDEDDEATATPSSTRSLARQVTRQICRLDMQATMFLVDWTPAALQEKEEEKADRGGGGGVLDTSSSFESRLPSSPSFRSLDQAADHLHLLVARTMRLRGAGSRLAPLGGGHPEVRGGAGAAPGLRDAVLAQLRAWGVLFEGLVVQGTGSPPPPSGGKGKKKKAEAAAAAAEAEEENAVTIALLRLHHAVAWLYLASLDRNPGGPGEADYDAFLPEFERCVALAGDVAAARRGRQRQQQTQHSTFTPEIGSVAPLYIVGAKCRDPAVRRRALGLLRAGRPAQEAVWDSAVAARVVERVVEIEEAGLFPSSSSSSSSSSSPSLSATTPSSTSSSGSTDDRENTGLAMGDIPAWRRVEALSWTRGGAAGLGEGELEVVYTLCGREGVHREVLAL